jgi:DNA-binding CsgD family transcriptional regulator
VVLRGSPLVGRDAELAVIEASFADAQVPAVVLVGATGAGRSRLAREALTRFAACGRRTEWIAATRAAASVPFGAVAHLLPPDRLPEGDPLAVVRAALAHVRGWGGRTAVVIGIDDAHLLDDGSATVVGHLGAQGLAFLLLTVRRAAAVPDATAALWKDGGARRLDLRPLSRQAVDRLLDRVLPGDLDGPSRRFLHRSAAGNPLALSELIRAGTAAGTLRRRYGVWRWEGECRAPGRLPDLVADRLRALDAGTREVLELTACGEPVPLALLERLTDPAATRVAEDSGLLVVERDGARLAARLSHPLYGELLRATLPATGARERWRRLARAAAEMPMRRRDDPLRVAIWQLRGGVADRPDVLRGGARQAIDRADLDLAQRLAQAARDAEPGPDADSLLAEILEYRGRSTAAAAVLSAQPPPAGADRARWAVARASTLYWGAGRTGPAERVLDLAGTGPGADLVEATRAWILFFDARCTDALAVARRVLADPAVSEQAVIWACAAGTAAAGFAGRPGEVDTLGRRGRQIAAACRDTFPWGVVEVGYGICLAQLALGDLAAASRVAEDGYRSTVDGPATLMCGGWAGMRGLVEAAQGRPGPASASLREAVAALDDNDTFRLVRCWMAALAGVAALTGDAAAAQDWMARAGQRPGGANRIFAPWTELWRAWTRAAEGATTEAARIACAAAGLAATTGLSTVEVLARYHAIRLGTTDPDNLSRLRTVAQELGTPFADALATAGAALRPGVEHVTATGAGVLVRAAGTFQALGHLLLATEALTVAARAYRAAGRRASANVHAEKAAALRAQCAGTRTPLSHWTGPTELLTPREREVALLAVRYSSAEIALRLGLSVRTVDNNLARAYAKLGVSGRARLRTLLDGEPG